MWRNYFSSVIHFKDQSFLIEPFGSSTVILIGAEESPWAQSRDLIICNLLVGISDVFFSNVLGVILVLVDLW